MFADEVRAGQVDALNDPLVIQRHISTRGKLIQVFIFLMQFGYFLLGPLEFFVLDFKLCLVYFQFVNKIQDIQGGGRGRIRLLPDQVFRLIAKLFEFNGWVVV